MQIHIVSRGFFLTEALRHAVEQEASSFSRRLGKPVRRVSVRLYDINGNHGGADMACSVQAHLGAKPATLIATDIDANMYRAIGGAFLRLERGARRALARARDRLRDPERRIRKAALPARPAQPERLTWIPNSLSIS
jgi:ribosome-associated translation inhibitor RaiA